MTTKTKIIVLTLFAFTISFNVKSQNFTLPEGYEAFKDSDGKEHRVDGDFDGDGLNDLAIVCATKNGENIVVVYLASKFLIDQSYWSFPWNYFNNKLSFTNNVLNIESDDYYDYIVLKLKYYSNLKNLKLIGFSRKYYLRHPTTFVGSNSINLNTNEYSVNGGPNKKININTITLSDIEKHFEFLREVGGVFN